ncbi:MULTISPECIES: SPFH domain-containing protein [unclassified Bradyrhizobium]|uniref:SPFH domain-containing protein n=1 Tax=unclassified Bradyrhizobium TaxID=2631580 RepID=UPI0003F8F461|nr:MULTISPECIES: SPFH domain-containing protein [unclassified Bradyrhizobium]MCP3462556.1 SPFH domain-containing protein [Bradyrhizobium sp. CCGUVB23]
MDFNGFNGAWLIQPALWAAAAVAFLILLRVANIFRYIPNNQVGIVEKLWTTKGSIEGGFIALNGEAGYEPEVLRGGLHVFFPFMYRIHKSDLVTVGQGKIAYVFARDGAPLGASQVLGANDTEDKSDFEDARRFLLGGGQKGPQRKILREGTYAINTTQFAIITDDRVYGHALSEQERGVLDAMQLTIAERWGFAPVVLAADHDLVGIVTVHDGPSLPPGEIIAPEVGVDLRDWETFHNNFQEPEQFLRAGGYRGRQLQIIVEGTWYINRLFATVEAVPKTVIPVGNVGVVIFYTGPQSDDVSGEQYRHGELVLNGGRGVWRDPLLPGKYAFNTYAGKIEIIPTVNFILKWVRGEVGAMKLDENLSEISLITKDAFEPTLPLSVVMHIDYKKAPMIIQRFGDVKKLVEQTLDPMVSAFFKNIAQKMTLIELLQNRASVQEESAAEMKAKFASYSLDLQEVLIGTPRAASGDHTIENILIQLRSRQIAREQIETYQEQEKAAVQERALNEAKATAAAQSALTQSLIQIKVNENEGAAALARAQKDAETRKVTAAAVGEQSRLEGQGEADRVLAIGAANAQATKLSVEAYGGPEFRLAEQNFTKFAEALTRINQPLVPQFLMSGGPGQETGNAGLIPTAMLSSMFGRMMPDALERLKDEAPKAARKANGQ